MDINILDWPALFIRPKDLLNCGWKIDVKLIPIMEMEGVPDFGFTVVYCKCQKIVTVLLLIKSQNSDILAYDLFGVTIPSNLC